jgi:uridine phosphorylase
VTIPLEEFDATDNSVHRPRPIPTDGGFPDTAVLCFFREAIEEIRDQGRLVQIGKFSDEIGGAGIFATPDRSVAVFHPGVGGPLSAHCLEQAIASGVISVLAIGGAGALVEEFSRNDVMVVESAVRDEGTSFHYLPPGRRVDFDPNEVQRIVSGLGQHGISARTGMTWTTDADFRETHARVERRRAEGCAAVEMEAASLAAVCQFRGVKYSHVLYSGDALHGEAWSERAWTTSTRRSQLLEAAIALRMQ